MGRATISRIIERAHRKPKCTLVKSCCRVGTIDKSSRRRVAIVVVTVTPSSNPFFFFCFFFLFSPRRPRKNAGGVRAVFAPVALSPRKSPRAGPDARSRRVRASVSKEMRAGGRQLLVQ